MVWSSSASQYSRQRTGSQTGYELLLLAFHTRLVPTIEPSTTFSEINTTVQLMSTGLVFVFDVQVKLLGLS